MSEISITRLLYSAKGLTIKSLMRLPTIYLAGRTATVESHPVLIFQYEPKRDYNAPRPKDNYYKVNPRNFYRVKRFFRHVLNWFEDPAYEALFILDEHEGKVIVNMEMRNLQEKLFPMSQYDAQSMMAIPAVITQDSVQSEGCALCINRTNYVTPLRDEEIASIYGILENFSFQAEATLLLDVASHPELYLKEAPQKFSKSGAGLPAPQSGPNVNPADQFRPVVVW